MQALLAVPLTKKTKAPADAVNDHRLLAEIQHSQVLRGTVRDLFLGRTSAKSRMRHLRHCCASCGGGGAARLRH
jgi:hypothetical protein